MTGDRARALVLAHGWNATAYQILNPGISHWFSARGDAVIGYVRHAGVRVVAGAPVCPGERLADVAREFEADARRSDERVCYFGAEARLEATLARSTTHSFVLLGEQPAWEPEDWEGRTTSHPSLRAQLRRASRKGIRVVEERPEAAQRDPSLRRCLAAWLETRGLPPLHFLIEPETLASLADRRVFVARGAGETVGFLIASVVPARRGWLIEQFVRSPEAPNGTVELLIDSAVRALARDGARYVTLGLAPLAHHVQTDPPGTPPFWLRLLLAWMRAHGRRFYDFRGLERFKEKFAPMRWEPVFAIADQPGITPRTVYAIAAAFTGGAPLGAFARAIGRAAHKEAEWMLSPEGRSIR